jgi:uncharacterized protein YmfQ (DUF2313 family)
MSSIPLPALNVQTPQQTNPLDSYGKMMQIKAMMGQQQAQSQQLQMGNVELQQKQLQLQDEQKARQVFSDPSIDWTDPNALKGVMGNLVKSGVSPQTALELQTKITKSRQDLATLDKTTLENDQNQLDSLYTTGKGIQALPPEQRPAAYQAAIQKLPPQVQASQHLPPQYPGDDQFNGMIGALGISHNMYAAEARNRQAATGEQKQANEAPGQVAGSQQKQLQVSASQLAMSQNQDDYQAKLDQLPHGVAKMFPQQFDKQAVLKAGMTPDQVVTTDQGAQRIYNESHPTAKDQYVQAQENYRAALGRQATNANEIQRQGLGNLQKQSDAFTQFLSSANTLKQSLQAAGNGNQMAAAIAPLQGTLFITTTEGVKRINETELQGVSGAGSLVQRINGALRKTTGSGPLSPQLKDDMSKLVDLYANAKYQTYKTQAQYTQQLHGLDQAQTPILGPDGSITTAVPASRIQPPANANPAAHQRGGQSQQQSNTGGNFFSNFGGVQH